MFFNIKTKIMTRESWRNFEVDGEEIEAVADFYFWEPWWNSRTGVKRRYEGE